MELLNEVIRALDGREVIAQATVVGPESLPTGTLARKLVVHEEGGVVGTLGAPSLDERVVDACRQVMASAPWTRVNSYPLSAEEAAQMGLRAAGKVEVFVEAMHPAPCLLIVGAGHIAQPLARIGKMVGFDVAIVDDRPSLVTKGRFPDADQLIAGYYGEELSRYPVNSATYAVLVTRGHRHDEESLRAIIGSRAAYIGMIGSRRRVGAVLQHMAEDGFSREQIERIYTPIGIDIGAETPDEIAVGILAEIINVRRRGKRHSASMSNKEHRYGG